MPRQKKKTEIDFGDEESVLEDVCAALKADIDTCEIEEDSGLSGFGEGSVYLVTLGIGVPKSEGRAKEYNVAENYDQAYNLAVAVVRQDLEQGPELFDKDFIESHINTDKLRDELRHDVLDMRNKDLEDLAERDPEDFWKQWETERLSLPENAHQEGDDDEDEHWREPTYIEIEELAQKQAETELEDPMRYLEDIYGDDAAKEAIRIAGIDIDAAADDAVDTDGWEHYLARYDGNSNETDAGLVYWRVN